MKVKKQPNKKTLLQQFAPLKKDSLKQLKGGTSRAIFILD